MDFIDRISGRAFDLNAIFKFTQLDPRVQTHLQRVYATLACTLLVAALGVLAHVFLGVGGLLTMLGGLGSIYWLAITPSVPSTLNKRYCLLGATAFCEGCSLGPLVAGVYALDPSIITTAFLGTATVFACFSLSALTSPRRTYIYLGGFLSSAILSLFFIRMFVSASGSFAGAFVTEIYGGLAVFLLYILFDTQMIIEKAYAGNDDHIKAALDLFVDFVAVFVRIMILLAKKRGEDDKRKKKNN